jgi:hypothetical protein
MKKRAIVCLIFCFVAAGVSSILGETNADEKARLEKQQKMQEEYFKKHGEYKKIKLPAPVKAEAPTPIDIASLKKIAPKDIASMQIYRLERVDLKFIKKYLAIPFGEDSRQEIEAVMRLIKKAPKMIPANSRQLDLNDPDRVLEIRLVDGATYEIRYNSHLNQPFAGLESRRLKEALYGLSCNSNKLAIMQVKSDKSIDVHHMQAILVQRSGISSNGIVTVAFNLTAEGNLVLNLKVRDSSRTRILVDGEQNIQYGGAVVFNPLGGKDTFIAYLLEPVVR